ncbi:TetR/AcrR family transcriptional regulator [Streptomyces sp. NBC_01613]|uniref:TetR/AcrR family transcriptional regulator n=1 Tax=Streptomyces sp. NBC_01613 TaxID=2975896 RepID=UPI00386AB1E0
MENKARPARPGRRRTLDEQQILDAALRLLASGGASSVSVRRVAAEVGVAPNAVYTYFPDKAAVVRGLVERILGEADHGAFTDPELPWRQRIHALANDLRARLIARPGAIDLLLAGPMDGPNALALGETLLAILADAGLDPKEAAKASYLLIVHCLGSIALEAAELDRSGPAPSEEERATERQAALAAVPADRYPRTASAADVIAEFITTEQFTWGLNRVLDGLAVRHISHSRDHCPTRHPAD